MDALLKYGANDYLYLLGQKTEKKKKKATKMKKAFISLLYLLFLFCFISFLSSSSSSYALTNSKLSSGENFFLPADSIFVDGISGTDSPNCGSYPNSPCRSISQAISLSNSSFSTIVIKYVDPKQILNRSQKLKILSFCRSPPTCIQFSRK